MQHRSEVNVVARGRELSTNLAVHLGECIEGPSICRGAVESVFLWFENSRWSQPFGFESDLVDAIAQLYDIDQPGETRNDREPKDTSRELEKAERLHYNSHRDVFVVMRVTV
jgi:hypothetical protein